jgi:hypothetical protein
MFEDQQENFTSNFHSISVHNLFKLAKMLFPVIQSDLTRIDLVAFQKADGTYHHHPTLNSFSDMTSDHVRIYFMKHKIHPHIQFPEYFCSDLALIVLTYQWILTFSEIEDFFSEESIDNFNHVHSGKCEEIPLDLKRTTVWIDILFNYQCAKDFEKVLDNSEAQYRNCQIHCALGTKSLFTRGFCLLELAIRNDASKSTGVLESCHRVAAGKLDARTQDPMPRQYFEEMAVTNASDEEKIKSRILSIFRTPNRFNLLLHDLRRTMTLIMAGSISIENVIQLSKKIVEDAQEMGYDGLGNNPTSHQLKEFFTWANLDPRLAYPQYFNSEPPLLALSNNWSAPLSCISSYFSPDNLAVFNRRYEAMFGKLLSKQEATVYVDIFFKNPQIQNSALELKLATKRFQKARFHCVTDNVVVWNRAWILLELIIRKEAGGLSGVLQSPEEQGCDTGNDELVRDYFNEMVCTCAEDLDMIKLHALRTLGSPDQFNAYIISVRRSAPREWQQVLSRQNHQSGCC